jgi:hypothetical protein
MARARAESGSWDSQIQYIETLENRILEADAEIPERDVIQAFQVLGSYLDDENKNVVQRSLKIIEALSNEQARIAIPSRDFPGQLVKCWSDHRANIRQQATRTISTLASKVGIRPFLAVIDSRYSGFASESRGEVISFLEGSIDLVASDDWSLLVGCAVARAEDKSGSVRSRAAEFVKSTELLAVFRAGFDRLTPTQRRLIQPLLEKPSPAHQAPPEDAPPKAQNPPTPPKQPAQVYLNTSAFLRKSRQKMMSEQLGIDLLTDSSTYAPFLRQLSLDIRDVFDDELAGLLTSHVSADKVQAADQLKIVCQSGSSNFQNSVDILFRWCGIHFMSRNVAVAQSALSVLMEQLTQDVQIAKVEIYFLVPILLWNIATQSDAYTDLLHQLRSHCSWDDFGRALLLSLSLQHAVVISTVFEELEHLYDISGISDELRKLTSHPLSIIRDGAKRVIFKLSTSSVRRQTDTRDPVSYLQSHIQKMKTAPELVDDPISIFSALLDQFERVPVDARHIRYLLYATYAFLSEPVLSVSVNQKDLLTLVHLLCEFSMHSQPEFADALNAIGFVLVTVVSQLALFNALLEFLDEHIGKLDRKSFPFQVFSVGVSLLAVSSAANDLNQLRGFAKSVIGRGSLAKDDLRAVLCRSLLAEIVSLEQQRLNCPDHLEMALDVVRIQPIKQPVAPPPPVPKRVQDTTGEKYTLVSILKKLVRSQTRAEGVTELIKFDEGCPDDVIGVLVKLCPTLKKDIDDVQKLHIRRKS